jgi:hypothetical protein
MTIDNLTIGEAKAIAAMFAGLPAQTAPASSAPVATAHGPRKVLVCTEKRGVVFGTCENVHADPLTLTNARMCLRWSADIGGVFGLAEKGPFDASKSGNTTVSAAASAVTLTGITAVFAVTDAAILAWEAAPVAGRK